MYRIDTLLKLDQKLFHTGDLALLWNIGNKNTLYTTIKRYVDRGVLISIHKGFYATVPPEQIDPFRLAQSYLHRSMYVSCETILVHYGVIFQQGHYRTIVSSISKKFSVVGHAFQVRKMSDRFLFNDFGLSRNNDVLFAELERAVADTMYYNPKYHFDNRKIINWARVAEIRREVGY